MMNDDVVLHASVIALLIRKRYEQKGPNGRPYVPGSGVEFARAKIGTSRPRRHRTASVASRGELLGGIVGQWVAIRYAVRLSSRVEHARPGRTLKADFGPERSVGGDNVIDEGSGGDVKVASCPLSVVVAFQSLKQKT